MTYFREWFESQTREEMTEKHWLSMAREFVIDVEMAIEHGFDTANAHYWAVR